MNAAPATVEALFVSALCWAYAALWVAVLVVAYLPMRVAGVALEFVGALVTAGAEWLRDHLETWGAWLALRLN